MATEERGEDKKNLLPPLAPVDTWLNHRCPPDESEPCPLWGAVVPAHLEVGVGIVNESVVSVVSDDSADSGGANLTTIVIHGWRHERPDRWVESVSKYHLVGDQPVEFAVSLIDACETFQPGMAKVVHERVIDRVVDREVKALREAQARAEAGDPEEGESL